MVGLPDCKTTLKIIMYNCSDWILACDRRTDRQTDGRTSCDSIVRAMHTRRAVIKSSAIYNEYLTGTSNRNNDAMSMNQ